MTIRFSRSMHQTKEVVIDIIVMFDRQAGLERTHFATEAHGGFEAPFLPGGPGATQAPNGDNIVPVAHPYDADAASFAFSSVDPAVHFTSGKSVTCGFCCHITESSGGPPAHEAPNRFDGGGGGEDGCPASSGDWACPPRAWLDGSGGAGSPP